MADTPFLNTQGISKIYKGATAAGLKPTDLEIAKGKITAIIGASGSGKTTLLHMIFGLITPDTGAAYFKGERVWGPTEKLIPGHDAMKMVTQQTDDMNIFAKVYENISVLLPNTDIDAKHRKTGEVIEQLNMKRIADKRVADLSGGERQRVAIARALVTQPQVLLLDEPFNQVDTSFREGLQQDIRKVVRETGLTVLMVSHDPAEVLSMADDLIVLRDGEILERGHPKDLYNDPQHLYTARLLTNCNILTKEEAILCGITAAKDNVVIYPDWVSVTECYTDKQWQVKQILFKGFYEELLVQNGNLSIRIMNAHLDRFKEGDAVQLKVRKYLEY
ncbi:ABC transporter ATP-binding protein [Mucilaginibacter myungsuensis]|uniref:ABC transporter ATP-binding protein n=1 Tax=Mucilaginibacter myungsuensis TaxID=649104 RepID=A0A929PWW0_9SPHI|nr:ABC transporter ATP-binding protein [Mucilaginibacter myungsuensis]MBE9662511.1 ABC transporter ATP-binding protein [Mucilaginibacter myungsuensis]MDN3597930.1 ABC transporter ATP-binding protein [Mucilaginibacter myungsuensis]